jgi:hypothetical protein
MHATIPGPRSITGRRPVRRKKVKRAVARKGQTSRETSGAGRIEEPEPRPPSSTARGESLETDVAPDLIDREPETGDDLR